LLDTAIQNGGSRNVSRVASRCSVPVAPFVSYFAEGLGPFRRFSQSASFPIANDGPFDPPSENHLRAVCAYVFLKLYTLKIYEPNGGRFLAATRAFRKADLTKLLIIITLCGFYFCKLGSKTRAES
jgi:hypothetical protein